MTTDTTTTGSTSTSPSTSATNAEASAAPVSILGLGPMGRALATALLDTGHPTTVWNRSPEKATGPLRRGAAQAETAAEAATAGELVIVCVLDYDAVDAILDPIADELRGRTVVNLTSDSPERARGTAEWARQHGVHYLDGSIMTPAATIGTDDAVLLHSGPEDVYREHSGTLADIGGTHTYLGSDVGTAAAYDVSLLDVFWTAMSGYVHALALARAEGVAASELAPYAHGIAAILPTIMTQLASEVDTGDYSGEDSNIVSAAAGMGHIIGAAERHGIDTGVLRAGWDIARRAIDAGHGREGFARLAETVAT